VLECVCGARELPGFSAALSVLLGDAARLREAKRLQIFYKRETNADRYCSVAGRAGVRACLRRIHREGLVSGVT